MAKRKARKNQNYFSSKNKKKWMTRSRPIRATAWRRRLNGGWGFSLVFFFCSFRILRRAWCVLMHDTDIDFPSPSWKQFSFNGKSEFVLVVEGMSCDGPWNECVPSRDGNLCDNYWFSLNFSFRFVAGFLVTENCLKEKSTSECFFFCFSCAFRFRFHSR